jgi:hypothetical protein
VDLNDFGYGPELALPNHFFPIIINTLPIATLSICGARYFAIKIAATTTANITNTAKRRNILKSFR